MIAAVRTSKRTALLGALGALTLFLCILAVKDMNDKLGVMTASNAGYQKMTDKQAERLKESTERIKSLTVELEALRNSKLLELKAADDEKNELEVKVKKLETETSSLQKRLDDVTDFKVQIEHDRDELKRMMGRQKQDAEGLSVQLRDQIAKISIQRDTCQRQYDALFKLQQEASDSMANLAHDKERLKLQLTDATQPPINFAKSSTMQKVGLEEPHKFPQIISQSSTSKHAGSSINAAPVGAQPPINNPVFNHAIPLHQIKKEDVMEAPKVHFGNLDAQEDPLNNHPGLQAPVYRDNLNVAFDEDDIEDNADGQIPNDYHNNKIANHRSYDQLNDIDYDFQADFQPKRVIPKPRQQQVRGYQQQQQPLIIQDHYRHAQIAPQVGHPGHPQFAYRRGL